MLIVLSIIVLAIAQVAWTVSCTTHTVRGRAVVVVRDGRAVRAVAWGRATRLPFVERFDDVELRSWRPRVLVNGWCSEGTRMTLHVRAELRIADAARAYCEMECIQDRAAARLRSGAYAVLVRTSSADLVLDPERVSALIEAHCASELAELGVRVERLSISDVHSESVVLDALGLAALTRIERAVALEAAETAARVATRRAVSRADRMRLIDGAVRDVDAATIELERLDTITASDAPTSFLGFLPPLPSAIAPEFPEPTRGRRPPSPHGHAA